MACREYCVYWQSLRDWVFELYIACVLTILIRMVAIDQIELSWSHFPEGRLANACDNCRLNVVFVIVSEWMWQL